MIIDAASMRTSGARLAKKARAALNIPLILVSPEGTKKIDITGAFVNLIRPFTHIKLLNRVTRFSPSSKEDVIHLGKVSVFPSTKRVINNSKDTRLTPKQLELLELLVKKQGEVVTRKEMMKKVWRTDYLGDTRTIDTHVTWLRQAIENNPRKPKLLVTIKKVGYRLDIPET